jgi:hypothetical protein
VPTNVSHSSTAICGCQTPQIATRSSIRSLISTAACVIKLAVESNSRHYCCLCTEAASHAALFAHDHPKHLNTISNHKPTTILHFELACTWPCLLTGQQTVVTAKKQCAKTEAHAHHCAHIQELNQCRSCQRGEHSGTPNKHPNHSCWLLYFKQAAACCVCPTAA